MTESLLGFCREKLGVFIKTGFSFSKETLGWKSFGKVTICYFFEYRAGKVQLAVEKMSAGLSSSFLPLHWNILKKKILKSFCIFCGLFGSIPVSEQGKFGRPVKTAFSVSIETFFEKKTVLETNEIFYLFQTLSRNFWPLFFSWTVYWSCILRVHRNNLVKQNVFQNIHFSIFLDNKRIFIDTLSEKFRRGCQK